MRLVIVVSAALLSSFVAVRAASAQDCGCDHTLALDVTVADGQELGIMPGDVVCLESGDRQFLRLQQFFGAEGNPIVVTNCDGQVSLRNTDRAYALVIEGASHHLRVTGSGAEGVTYGIRASAPDEEPYGGVGVWIQGRSTDIEVDHVEVYETGFAGVMAKTDPSCDDRPFWDDYIMRNTHLHHLWVHDTGGEGFYVGSTQAAGYARSCPDGDVTIPAHFLEGVSMHDILVEDTGWDGAQIGFARTDCHFTDNVMRRVGGEGVEFQQQLLQIGAWSSCEVRRNILTDGPAMGIIVLDSDDSLFADNLIARVGADGIYANLRDLVDAADWRFVHNTIADFAGSSIRIFGDGVTQTIQNNLIVDAEEPSLGSDADGNFRALGLAEAGVTDDFHVLSDSPARGAGLDLTGQGFASDLENYARATPPTPGAYEYRDPAAPDAGPINPTDGGAGPSPDASPSADGDSSGCGCTTSPATSSPPLALLLLALISLLWLKPEA